MVSFSAKNEAFEPLHDAHAIEQVVFVIQFSQALDDDSYQAVLEHSKKYEAELPARHEIQLLSFVFGAPNAAAPVPNAGTSHPGLILRRVAADGSVDTEMRIERSSLTIVTTAYTRWNSVWVKVKEYLDGLVPLYAAHTRVFNISLNYVDKFIWNGKVENCNPSLLLSNKSKYLSPHIFDVADFWHSHTGAFYKIDDYTKRLLNINVNYLDEFSARGEPRRVISLTTVITDNFDQPGYLVSEYTVENVGKLLDEHLNSMHLFGKSVLADILIDDIQQRIALNKN